MTRLTAPLRAECIDCGGPCRRPGHRCRGCNSRFVTERAHAAMPVRFWAQVDRHQPNGCWLWTGRLDRYGYGQVSLDQRTLKAHRIAYGLTIGLIPAGLHLDHLCRVRACVNPAHLEPVTNEENVRRSRKALCVRGHSSWVDRRSGRSRRCRECQNERNARVRGQVAA